MSVHFKLKLNCLIALGALLLIPFGAMAVDPARHISQYGHTAWRIQDGVFSGAPNAIAQTTDGYLWIGTQSGLVRFDGVRFVPWVPLDGKGLNSIFSLLAARDGSLWIGKGTNLAHLRDGAVTNFEDHRGRINSIVEDRSGEIWITRSRVTDPDGGLCQVVEKRLRCYGKGDGYPSPYGGPLVSDDEGNLWIGSTQTVTRWRPGSATTYSPEGLSTAANLSGVQGIAAGPDGSLWIGMNRKGQGLGLQMMKGDGWQTIAKPNFDSSQLEVNTLFLDHENALWIGTESQGVYRIYHEQVDRFGSADGLSSDTIRAFYPDREGNIWVATSAGIDCFRNTRIVNISTRDGLSGNEVNSVLATHDGAILIGNHSALDSLRGAQVSSISAKQGLPGGRITSLFEDHAGRVWVGVDNGLFIYTQGKFSPVKGREVNSLGVIVAITEDRNSNIWAEAIGNPRRLLRIQDDTIRDEIPDSQIPNIVSLAADPHDGIWLGLFGDLARYREGKLEMFPFPHDKYARVRQVAALPDGSVFGATASGLIGWKDGKSQVLTVKNGLPCETIDALVTDSHQNLWLYAECGLIQIASAEMQRWWQQADTVLQVRVLDVFDGAQPGAATFQPRTSRSPDGRLWFANEYIVQMLDPANLTVNEVAPPIHIEGVIADRKAYLPSQHLYLPARTRDLEIDYTALSFVAPKKVRFRYRLEGRDPDWQEADSRRQAFYSDLGPGNYRFEVIACNNDGVWNNQPAVLEFSIAPAWYQRTSLRILAVLIGLYIIWMLYRLRVRQIATTIGARFDERLDERTRMARELHDTFLQTVQGSKMVADDALEKADDPVRLRKAVEQLSVWLDQATAEGRAALNSLRTSTIEENDLAAAFKRATGPGLVPSSMSVAYSVVGDPLVMHPIVRDEIYRIGYEAIHNACLHSHASRLEFELKYGNNLTVLVKDNGVGIDPSIVDHGKAGHFGLPGMRERAARIGAKLTILSSATSGTEVTLVVPANIVFSKTRDSALAKLKSLIRRRQPRA
jgi:signal transduction histidine kinase/streptogramin lyase